MSLLELPKFFHKMFKKLKTSSSTESDHENEKSYFNATNSYKYLEWGAILLFIFIFLTWFKFNFLFQLYLVAFTAICTYQLLIIGGELGLAPVARFATFVMMPALLFFNATDIHVTLISTFVEVCGGVAVDVLFGRKFARLSNLETKKVRAFQWLGLVVSALSVGVLFWILITKFGLGSAELIAQRSQTRALTVRFQNFDFYSMILGALYGALLKDFKISPIMVLGGVLMPLEWAIALIIGGTISSLMKNAEEYQPFWSGVFAANSIAMIIKALI
jgi:hypothetical protein